MSYELPVAHQYGNFVWFWIEKESTKTWTRRLGVLSFRQHEAPSQRVTEIFTSNRSDLILSIPQAQFFETTVTEQHKNDHLTFARAPKMDKKTRVPLLRRIRRLKFAARLHSSWWKSRRADVSERIRLSLVENLCPKRNNIPKARSSVYMHFVVRWLMPGYDTIHIHNYKARGRVFIASYVKTMPIQVTLYELLQPRPILLAHFWSAGFAPLPQLFVTSLAWDRKSKPWVWYARLYYDQPNSKNKNRHKQNNLNIELT